MHEFLFIYLFACLNFLTKTLKINALSGKTLQFDGIDGSRIKDATLRRHMKNFLSKPITMKFTTSSSKTPTYFKAIVKTSKGERLRGYWRQNKESGTFDRSKLLEMSYEEALKRKGGTPVECEVQLPPIKGHKPFVVYSIVLGRGSSSATACAIKSIGSVALLPKGREGKNYPLGKSLITFPLKGGIVDSGWAKGRTIFRSGRTMGKL